MSMARRGIQFIFHLLIIALSFFHCWILMGKYLVVDPNVYPQAEGKDFDDWYNHLSPQEQVLYNSKNLLFGSGIVLTLWHVLTIV